MAFKLVHYSQQDPQWKTDILSFGDASDTIGYVGCALTSAAMLISGHGYIETPKTLNQKLKQMHKRPSKAKSKIGKFNQWLLVRDGKENRGYVSAEYVRLA